MLPYRVLDGSHCCCHARHIRMCMTSFYSKQHCSHVSSTHGLVTTRTRLKACASPPRAEAAGALESSSSSELQQGQHSNTAGSSDWKRQQQQPGISSSSNSGSGSGRGRGRGSAIRGRGSSRPRPGHSNTSGSWSDSQQTDAAPQQQQLQQQWQPVQHQQQQRPRSQQQQQQQQPQLLFQGSSAAQGSAAADPGKTLSGLLVAKLSNSRDLQELAQVLEQHKTTLGPVHISAAICRAAKLHPGLLSLRQPPPWQQQQQLTEQQRQQQQLQGLLLLLLPLFNAQLPDASLVEVSCVVGALARMGCYNAPSDVIDACLDATRHGLGEPGVSNKELLQLAWGFARMGRRPDDGWLAAFEEETRSRMHSLNNVETANVLWAFAKWGAPPTAGWLASYLAHLPSQLLALQPPELCSVLWAAAMLQLQLPGELLDGVLLEAQVKFGGFTGQGLGTLAWSLARMDMRPKRFWLQDFVRHSGAMLPALAGGQRDQAFTNIIWALGCWEHHPPQAWLQEYCRCVVPQLPHMTAHGLAIVAVGLAELNHMPPQQFTSYLLELFHKQLATASPGQAASFIWALPRLLLPLTHSQAAAAAAAAAAVPADDADSDKASAGYLQQQQGGAGGVVGSPAGGWLRQYCWLLQDTADVLLRGMDKLPYTELVDAASGFADLGFFPGFSGWTHTSQTSTVTLTS
ncbi:hypothetical protein COO60DRAFT_661786 [Scenedesmus sp. NREL 46B-D3]|nr:hypothetical protein COO60DRAFT_661786 [Scenedesmus sp. NREL 46B-D3]